MTRITVPMRDGRSLSVRVVGRGAPVVMLCGLGMTSGQWLPFVAPFLRSHRFYMPDYRGFGGSISVPPRAGDLFDGHADDVADLIAHFGLRDHALAGYSLGASTSLHLLRSGRFASVSRYLHIDQSPFVGTSDSWRYGLLGERQVELSARLASARDRLAAHSEAEFVVDLPAEARRALAKELGEASIRFRGPRGVTSALGTVFASPRRLVSRLPLTRTAHLRLVLDAYASCRHDYREALRGCAVPVSVLVGMRSALYDPRGQMAIADYAPNARVLRFERSGHLAPFEEPRRFVRELGVFLGAG